MSNRSGPMMEVFEAGGSEIADIGVLEAIHGWSFLIVAAAVRGEGSR